MVTSWSCTTQVLYISHNESMRLLLATSMHAAFHDLIGRIDQICYQARFDILKRQAQEIATQMNRFQASKADV